MNILIPHTWLLDHLDTKATPQEIQKFVSLCGPSIERIYDREGDSVYDIEVTTNRVDSMSVRGIAREVAVILSQFGVKAKLKPYTPKTISFDKKTAAATLPLPKISNDSKLCRRIVCVSLADAKRNATPEWMAKRLRQVELNVHDAVIDITNYITHDLGHPCHAFDYDKIMEHGGMILVKLAKAGKNFTTLDGSTFTTVGGELVFENESGEIIDLPGIKGTANTAIQASTKNVLFFIENSVPEKIRFGSMSHAIRTVAAQLNEKNVDPHLALPVLEAGTTLFEELTGAKVASPLFDEFPGKRQLPIVKVSLDHIATYLGLDLPVNKIAKILEDLGCGVTMSKQMLSVQPPTFRPDITIAADVIEEIARIYGYHNLPSVLMPTAIPLEKPKDTNFTIEDRVKRFLSAIGWQEVYTYSMVSEELALQSGYSLAEQLRIQNPLTDDRVYMRRSLLPSLAQLVEQNSQYPTLSVFELANVYPPQEGTLPHEHLHISLLSRRPLASVKGDLEALLRTFFVKDITYTQTAGEKAEIVVTTQDESQHSIGTIHMHSKDLVAIDIPMSEMLKIAATHPKYQPLPKTNAVIEDLTFTLPLKTQVGEVVHTIKKLSSLLARVEVVGQYQQNISFRITYHDLEKQIAEETVFDLRTKVISHVKKHHAGQLVGEIK